MTDPNRFHVQPSYSGNIFLFIMEVMAKHKNAVDEDIAMRFNEADLTNLQYQAGVDKWKEDAAKLPDAGHEGHIDAKDTINNKGIAQIAGTAAALMVVGLALAWTGVGGLLFAVGVALMALIAAIMITEIAKPDILTNGTDQTPGYEQYDPAKQAQASNTVQTDQTEVQRLQNYLSQIMQQYINPANDLKSQDANMIQAAMQWMKAMMWSQGAA